MEYAKWDRGIVSKAKRMRGYGATHKEIADALGMKVNTVIAYTRSEKPVKSGRRVVMVGMKDLVLKWSLTNPDMRIPLPVWSIAYLENESATDEPGKDETGPDSEHAGRLG